MKTLFVLLLAFISLGFFSPELALGSFLLLSFIGICLFINKLANVKSNRATSNNLIVGHYPGGTDGIDLRGDSEIFTGNQEVY